MTKGMGWFAVVICSIGLFMYLNKGKSEQVVITSPIEKRLDKKNLITGPLPSKQASSTKEIPPANCNTFEDDNWYTIEQAQINLSIIKSKPMEYFDARLDENVIDIIAFKSGIGAPSSRALREKREDSTRKPRFYFGEVELHRTQDLKIVKNYIETKDTGALLSAISSGNLNTNASYYTEKGMEFLVGKLISSGVISVNLINLLLDYNTPIYYSDLVAATQVGLPVDIIRKMHTASGLSASAPLYDNGSKYSLLNFAISLGHYELALYWLEEGSTAEPDEFVFNALDLLARYHKRYTSEQINDLATLIFRAELAPKSKRSADKLKSLLSSNTKNKFQHLLEPLGDKAFNQVHLKLAQQYVDTFFIQLLNQGIDKNQVTNYPLTCLRILGKRVVKYAIRHGYRTDEVQQKTPNNDSLSQSQPNKPIQVVTNISDEQLGTIQSIEDKAAVEQNTAKELEEQASAIKQNFEAEKANQEENFATLQKIIELAMAGHWQTALKLVDVLKLEERVGIYTALLNIALSQQGADIRLIEKLMKKGAILSDSSITYLLQSDNVVLAEKMLRYGLDLNYVDPLGYNTITNSVKNESLNMLNFLILNEVSVLDKTTGFDALDFALKNFKMYLHKDAFVKILIDAGIEVETSHKQWVSNMFIKSPDDYYYLVSKYSMLAN